MPIVSGLSRLYPKSIVASILRLLLLLLQLRLQTIIASILAVQINLFNEIFLSILGFNRRRSWKADGGNVAGVRGN